VAPLLNSASRDKAPNQPHDIQMSLAGITLDEEFTTAELPGNSHLAASTAPHDQTRLLVVGSGKNHGRD